MASDKPLAWFPPQAGRIFLSHLHCAQMWDSLNLICLKTVPKELRSIWVIATACWVSECCPGEWGTGMGHNVVHADGTLLPALDLDLLMESGPAEQAPDPLTFSTKVERSWFYSQVITPCIHQTAYIHGSQTYYSLSSSSFVCGEHSLMSCPPWECRGGRK